MLPFKKDLNVNSPLSAILAPRSVVADMIFFIIIVDPWDDISTRFSFVYDFGSLNMDTSTSSIISFLFLDNL